MAAAPWEQYADYESQATNALRLAMARSYNGELRKVLGPNYKADGFEVNISSVNVAIKTVREDIRRYEQADRPSRFVRIGRVY